MRLPLSMIASDALPMTMLASRIERPEWEPPPTGTTIGVAVDQMHAVERHAEPFGDQLREAGLVALALDRVPITTSTRPSGATVTLGPLARRAGGELDVIGDADAAAFAARAPRRAGVARSPPSRRASSARSIDPLDSRRCRRPCRTGWCTASRRRRPGCAAATRCGRSRCAAAARSISRSMTNMTSGRPALR